MQFSIRSSLAPPDVHLAMDGELDIFSAGQVGRALGDALGAGCRRALLDVSGVTFVDASALGVLVRARELMRSCAGSLEVTAFSPVFLRLCVLTELVWLIRSAEEAGPVHTAAN
jgi:anti-sigma B factor antagonist